MSSDMEIDEFTALHGLVLKKAGQAGEVAEVLGATEAEVAPALDAAVAEKRAMSGRGKYMVTPAGRAWLDEQYPVLFADLRADPGADAAYAGFEEVNRELLALMTRWQTVTVGGEAVPNDHSDADYDAAVAGPAGEAATSDADPVLDPLAGLVPRLGVHRRRLPRRWRGRRRARPTTSAACAWRATTPSGSSCTKTCCGCWAATREP